MAIRISSVGPTTGYDRTTNLPTGNAFSILGWAYITTDRNDWSTFWEYGGNDNGGDPNGNASGVEKNLQTAADGTTLHVWNGANGVTGTALTVGTWYHLGLTYDGTNTLAYVNGVLDITNGSSPGDPGGSGANHLRLANDAFTEPINGRLAAIKVYSAVLTAAEIANEMRQYLPLRTANLNSFYPFVDPTVANNTRDFSGNGYNFTSGGTLTFEDGPPIPWSIGVEELLLPAGGVTVFTASAALTSGHTSLLSTASHDDPNYTSTADLLSGGADFAATASHNDPDYTATAGVTSGPASFTATAAFVADTVYSATAGVTSGPTAFAATGTFAVVSTFTATAGLTTGFDAASSGSSTKSAGAGASVSTGAEQRVWGTTGNITASDDSRSGANYVGPGSSDTQQLQATQFDFSAIDDAATIDGIKLEVEKQGSVAGAFTDLAVRLLKAGTATGDNKADTVTTWPTSDTVVSYGGATDKWGTTWTPSDVKASNFGGLISAHRTGVSGAPSVDHMQITVYWSIPGSFSASATFTPDVVYAATMSVTVGGADASATATHDDPNYTATSSVTSGHTALVATASHDDPNYTAVAAITSGGQDFNATASHDDPNYTATLAGLIGHTAFAATASFDNELRTATVALTIGGADFLATVTVINPVTGYGSGFAISIVGPIFAGVVESGELHLGTVAVGSLDCGVMEIGQILVR